MDSDDNHAEENQRHKIKQCKTQAFDRPATQQSSAKNAEASSILVVPLLFE